MSMVLLVLSVSNVLFILSDINLSVSMFISRLVCSLVCPYVRLLCFCQYVFLAVWLPFYLSIFLLVCLSICLSVYLSICSLVHQSVCITLLELLICFLFSANLRLNCEVFHDIDTELILVEDPIRIQDVKLKTRGGGFQLKLITTSVNCNL